MTLEPDDIEAIAEAVARKMREKEGLQLDEEYEMSFPVEVRKKRARAEMKRQDLLNKESDRLLNIESKRRRR